MEPRDQVSEAHDTRTSQRASRWALHRPVDYSSEFELVAVINQGRDLLLVHGGAGTKEPTALAPIHHVKLVKGKLHAVVTSHDKLFEWIAERK